MQILRRLPFGESPSTVQVAGEVVLVRSYQIVVWVSLGVDESIAASAPRFPAVLDTGHNHNFSLQERQLTTWAGIDPARCSTLGAVRVNRQEVPLRRLNLWLYRNRPRTTELLTRPVALAVPEGVAVYPADAVGPPRLPLLGLRALVRNGLRLVIDGGGVSLSAARNRAVH